MTATANAYDIAVIGGGAAGIMAAIRGGQRGRRVVLLERNNALGNKLMLTAHGRCNLTNTASRDVFIKKFSPGGEFLRSAFFSFSNEALMEFFRAKGLTLKVEKHGRVLPDTDKARSVMLVLKEYLRESGVDIKCAVRVFFIEHTADSFTLVSQDVLRIKAKKVIIATGGASYASTGSTGDGFAIAKQLGHTMTPLAPALVPLRTKEVWVKELQGLSLENVRITFHCAGKKLCSETGEMLFTHFGVSGPLVLDMSGDVVKALAEYKEVEMAVDFLPACSKEQLTAKLVDQFAAKGTAQIKNLMQDVLPKRMAAIFLSVANIAPEKRANQINKEERRAIAEALKAFPLTIVGSLALDEAMVTAGGVPRKEINPRTMESRLVAGLYFAGEVIEGRAPSGGYNLQQAFSTGSLAGEKAAESIC